MTFRYSFLAACFFCFLAGALLWRVKNEQIGSRNLTPLISANDDSKLLDHSKSAMILYVGDEAIRESDLSFEEKINGTGVLSSVEFQVAKEYRDKSQRFENPLREKLVSGLIERRALFSFIKQDNTFAINDPARFTECLQDWQKATSQTDEVSFTSEENDWLKRRICEQSIIQQYLREKVYKSIAISDKEIVEFYEKNQNQFIKPKRVSIRQIVTETEEEGNRLHKMVNRSNFASLASQFSVTPEAQKGGYLGPFAQGEMPKFFDLAFSLAEGEIYGVLKSPYGFHIIMVEKKYKKTEETLETARATVRKRLLEMQQRDAYSKWLESALNAIPVRTTGRFADADDR